VCTALFALALPPLAKGATGDLLLILLLFFEKGKTRQEQEQIPLNPPFSKGEA
jgi:hypothetical protein